MVLTGKVTGQFQTKSDISKFYELFKLLPNTFSKLIPSKVRSVDLLEGQFGALGCVMLAKYIKDGRVQEAKTVTEAVDDEGRSITFTFVEGDVMQRYKKFKVTLSFSSMGGDYNYANWTIDFEKLNEDVPEPNNLLNFIIDGCNDIELQGILQLMGISQPIAN